MSDEQTPVVVETAPPSSDVTSYQAYKAERQPASPPAAPTAPVTSDTPSAPPVPPADAEVKPESPAPAPAPETPSGEDDDDTPPPTSKTDTRTPTQRRIDQAVRRQRDAEREAVKAREEAARLRGRLEAIEAGVKPPTPPQAAPATTAAAMPDDPADPKPKFEDYPTYEEGVEATSRWVARQEFKRLQHAQSADMARREAERASQQHYNTYVEKVAEFKKTHPDWEEVVTPDLPATDLMGQLILRSEISPEITYYLGRHPDECRSIATLPPDEVVRQMARIEVRLEMEREAAKTAPPAPPAPAASAPTPVPPSPQPAAPVPVKPVLQPIAPVREAPIPATSEVSDFRAYRAKRLAGKPV